MPEYLNGHLNGGKALKVFVKYIFSCSENHAEFN
jgi:hypothetical protein